MKIKVSYEPLESKTPEERQRMLEGLAGALTQLPETYVSCLKTLLGTYGVVIDERERLIRQPALYGELDESLFSKLEQELLKLPGVKVSRQNEYKGF